MKACIALDHRKRDISGTGKGFFAIRLMEALKKLGVDFVSPEEKADIDLGIGRWQYKPNAKKKILRLGAAHINSNSDYKTYNARKLESLKIADAVIYQSWFSRRVCNKFIGMTDHPYEIIPNGAPISYGIDRPEHKYNFLASTRDWIPQKNLKGILKAFIEADNKDARLWVTGITHNIELKYPHNNITYLGLVEQSDLTYLYATCNAMINIVYADACPNNVVEALCAGCWILSSNSGGTQELIKKGQNGNVLNLYKDWYDFGLVDMSRPIKIDRAPLVEAFRVPHERHAVNDHVNIETIANKYFEFFKKVIDA